MWATILGRHPRVPAVVVTIGAGSAGVPRGVLKLAHRAADRWTPGGSDTTPVARFEILGEEPWAEAPRFQGTSAIFPDWPASASW